jgi:cytochrome c-type biogenesis protein
MKTSGSMFFRIMGIMLIFLLLTAFTAAGEGGSEPEAPAERPAPSGYVHRPVAEFFTGLSCPACMNGPEQDMEKLRAENADAENVPYTFIVFHELNGGGVDDLATEESKERMRHYQPGVSGTPDVEFDGGYIELGGMTGTTSINYQTATQALADSTTRYERQFNPWNPRQTIRNEFKFVELYVRQVFNGNGYAVMVEINYLGMDTLLLSDDLQGSLYVFIIEDNVTAYSTVLDENITNHNVFRGYAIKDHQFTLSEGDTYAAAGEWEIPSDATVPIKPGDLTAVAVVYDLDDTDSENDNQGNHAGVPRAIQSATPKSTAFDLQQDLPVLDGITITYDEGAHFSARCDDDNGISIAYVLYNTEAANATHWESVEMTVTGEELCDDSGACYAYTNSEATATIPLGSGETAYYMLLIYDGDANEGKTPVMTYTAEGSTAAAGGGAISLALVAMILGVLLLGYGFYTFLTQKKKRETTEVEPISDSPEGAVKTQSSFTSAKSPKKSVMLGAIILGMILISVGAVASVLPSGEEKVPDFAMRDVSGNEFRLSDFEGEVVLLEFMATWCSDCKKMTKEMKEVYDHYNGDIVMISLDIDRKESPELLESYADENGAKWIFAFPVDFSMVMNTFDIYEIPKSLIIDKDGFVTFEEILAVPSEDQIANIDAAKSGAAPAIALSSMPLLLLAFAAGVASFFSPCSFPMLPGYVGYYFGKETEDERKRTSGVLRRALPVGMAAALGILFVYILIGTLIMIIGSPILPYIPLLAPLVAIMIIVFGFLLLTNIQYYSLTTPIKNISDSLTSKIKFRNRTLKDRIDEEGTSGIFIYGMGYGMAAAGCTLPVFLFIIVGALSTGGFLSGMGVFMVYGLGAAIFMVAVTLLVAASKDSVVNKLKMSTAKIKTFSAILLIIAGFVLMAMYAVTFLL